MTGSRTVKFRVLLLAFLSISAIIVPPGDSRTVEEVVNSLKGLSPEPRQKRLEEGARTEGKAVYYGTIQADDARELLKDGVPIIRKGVSQRLHWIPMDPALRERVYRRSGEKAIKDYFNVFGFLPYASDAEKRNRGGG